MRCLTNHRLFAIALSLAMFVANTALAPAAAATQTITGTIVGHIVDPSGTGIAGVLVKMKSLTNGFAYANRTDASGYYHIELLPPDRYRITAEKDGFQPGAIESYTAEVNST